MGKFRKLISTFLLTATLLTTCALAQTNLTQVRDTINNSNGTPFNGTVVITWNGYSTLLSGTISPLSTSARIYNGALSVLLVPTATASAGTYYQVVYYSSDGTSMWTETWQVPASANALSVAAVRVSTTAGSGGSGSGGSGGGSGSGSSGNGQYATLPITISEVTNLSSSLSQINTTLTSLTNTVNNLPSGGTTNVVFVDGEVPSGSKKGSNNVFTLSQVPTPTGSLELYRNGLKQASGVDYSLAGQSLVFTSVGTPQAGDVIQAYYRTSGTSSASSNFADSETPSGSITGTNLAFTLAYSPTPIASLKLYKNGMLLQENNDYTLSGTTVTFVAAAVPQVGDSLAAYYRH